MQHRVVTIEFWRVTHIPSSELAEADQPEADESSGVLAQMKLHWPRMRCHRDGGRRPRSPRSPNADRATWYEQELDQLGDDMKDWGRERNESPRANGRTGRVVVLMAPRLPRGHPRVVGPLAPRPTTPRWRTAPQDMA